MLKNSIRSKEKEEFKNSTIYNCCDREITTTTRKEIFLRLATINKKSKESLTKCLKKNINSGRKSVSCFKKMKISGKKSRMPFLLAKKEFQGKEL